ncbi:MAG: pyridoxal-phosphate dependent enzyme [Gemmatimonadetes bacterium]|nr:pyridoxal-phosphate dependent enzyme [Gemmatimonadota bacterium]
MKVLTLIGAPAITAAARRLRGFVLRTPLLPAPELSVGGTEVRLKCESLQRAGSFKIRGAYNFMSQLSREELARGVITYSSGNHAQAVALAAGVLGTRAVVVMPVTAPVTKQEGARRLGAEVILHGKISLERRERAEQIAHERDLTIVPPSDHVEIMAGHGTLGWEILEDWPDVEAVLVPVGGGGLIAGVAAAVKAKRPDVRVIGVEPAGAASMRAALDAGQPVTLASISTIADGLAPVRAGDIAFAHVRELVEDVVLVDDDSIREASSFLLGRVKLVVEYSGAATVAAIRCGAVPANGQRIAAVLSGGNMDPSVLRSLA